MFLVNMNVLTRPRRQVLVCGGGAGRSSLELLRGCHNLDLVHSDHSAEHYSLLQQLLDQGQLVWRQPLEGQISQQREFKLAESETKTCLLSEKNNSLTCLHSTIGK